jgi:hypothetical protein
MYFLVYKNDYISSSISILDKMQKIIKEKIVFKKLANNCYIYFI